MISLLFVILIFVGNEQVQQWLDQSLKTRNIGISRELSVFPAFIPNLLLIIEDSFVSGHCKSYHECGTDRNRRSEKLAV